MGCTPGTTLKYSSIPRMYKMQKLSVSQGLYQSYYSPYWLWQLAPTPALVFCRVWTSDVSYLKRQSTTRPHQPIHELCGEVKVRGWQKHWWQWLWQQLQWYVLPIPPPQNTNSCLGEKWLVFILRGTYLTKNLAFRYKSYSFVCSI